MGPLGKAAFVVAAFLSLCSILPAYAADRIALVVGNSAYASTSQLPNAINDAGDFANLLKQNGFKVTVLVDARRVRLAQALTDLSNGLAPGDIAVFYFAGHGMQFHGENFLLGVDARLETEYDVVAETISLQSVVDMLERKSAVSLLFIDACRNNPLADQFSRKVDGIWRGGQTRGLAPLNAASVGTVVAFAASPGQVAYDGGGANSPFTEALVKHLAAPSLEIGIAFKRVIRDVRDRSGGKQVPQFVSNLADEIYLGSMALPTAAPASQGSEIKQESTSRSQKPEKLAATDENSSPTASAQRNFAAIAAVPSKGARHHGFAFGVTSSEAQQAALGACGRKACKIMRNYAKGECAVIAVGEAQVFWNSDQSGRGLQDIMQSIVNYCDREDRGCHLKVSICL